MLLLAGGALLLLAGAANFYAGFCLLGGPDGAILSRDSLVYGLTALLFSIVLTYAGSRFGPDTRWLYLPLLAPVAAWLAAIAIAQKAGFYLWLAGTPVLVIATIAYWIVVCLSTTGQQPSL
jgi:hypothetical protein